MDVQKQNYLYKRPNYRIWKHMTITALVHAYIKARASSKNKTSWINQLPLLIAPKPATAVPAGNDSTYTRSLVGLGSSQHGPRRLQTEPATLSTARASDWHNSRKGWKLGTNNAAKTDGHAPIGALAGIRANQFTYS